MLDDKDFKNQLLSWRRKKLYIISITNTRDLGDMSCVSEGSINLLQQ
jgi:hypothetical protein